jgi:hypothetical protein
MDWKEATGDGRLVDVDHEGRKMGEQGSVSPSRRGWKIKRWMGANLTQVGCSPEEVKRRGLFKCVLEAQGQAYWSTGASAEDE